MRTLNAIKLLALTSLILLTACSSDPMKLIPQSERVSIMAEAQYNKQINPETGKIDVTHMLENIRTQHPGKITETDGDYFITFKFKENQHELTSKQIHKLDRILVKFESPENYSATLSAGPSQHKDKLNATLEAEHRIEKIKGLLVGNVGNINSIYSPRLGQNIINLSFLTKISS